MLHGAGELGQSREGVQSTLANQGLSPGLGQQGLEVVQVQVQVQVSCSRSLSFPGVLDEGTEVPVEKPDPLEGLGPQVQITLLKQEVFFSLVEKTGNVRRSGERRRCWRSGAVWVDR